MCGNNTHVRANHSLLTLTSTNLLVKSSCTALNSDKSSAARLSKWLSMGASAPSKLMDKRTVHLRPKRIAAYPEFTADILLQSTHRLPNHTGHENRGMEARAVYKLVNITGSDTWWLDTQTTGRITWCITLCRTRHSFKNVAKWGTISMSVVFLQYNCHSLNYNACD